MSNIKLYIVCWLLLVISIYCVQCCGPAEIGRQYIITSTANVQTGDRVVWQVGNGVNVYDSSLPEPNMYPSLYTGTKTQLTIKSVTKNDRADVFHLLVDGTTVYACALPVYKKASTPICEPVTLIGNQLRTTCTTAVVYPRAKCQFSLQNGATDRRDISYGTSYITYTHTDPQPGVNDYYSTSCTLQYPVDGLKPGNWTIQVNMYPDLTGVSSDQGTVGQTANALPLSVPIVSIDSTTCPKGLAGEGATNVRQGYIRQGEQASCLCNRAHLGNPLGKIGWSSTQGGNFVNMFQSEVAATIQINSLDTFTCQSMSVLDGSHSMTYTPKYAYGPSSATLTFQRPGPIYLCPNQPTNIDITCQANSFSPAILFTIRDSNSNNLVTKVVGADAWNKSVNYNFTKSGQHTFTCRVENAIFSDIFSEASASAIQVYAPPTRPPFFQVAGQFVITDSSETWVKQGSHISVSCLAGKAYPLVKSVNVSCGQETSRDDLYVSGVSGNELACYCSVDHATKTFCNDLNLAKEMTIQTAYGPNDVIFSFVNVQFNELQNEPLNLCDSEGLDVTVICAVKQSDVRPGMTIVDFTLSKPSTFTTQQTYMNTSGGGHYRFLNKLKVTSGGSHVLICEGKNPKFSDIKHSRSMTVEVREPPREKPKMSARSIQNGDILMEEDDVTVTCEVSGGYPSVQSVTLTCGHDQTVTNNGISAKLTLKEIGLSYNETNCICYATHVTGCYDLYSVVLLIVLVSKQIRLRSQEDSILLITKAELAGVVIGSIVGTLVLVVVILLVVFIVRKEKAKRKNRSKDTAYDEIERPKTPPYQNVRPVDPNHPYQTINPPEQGSASNIESPNHETDHTYRNQIFDDNAEPDPNAYSEILN